MNQHFDCVIVGGGIAGMTAAIYLKRANKNVVIVEKDILGGQINKTSRVENYPGFTFIEGIDLVDKIKEQIKNLNIPIINKEVVEIKQHLIKLKDEILEADNIILATGRIPKKLGLENEDELIGRGISYCATCDGFFFKNKIVCVVGGGNSALEESLYLSNLCKKVIILNRSAKLRADDYLIDEVNKRNNIEIKYNIEIIKINKDEVLKFVTTKNEEIKCDGLFIYIGLEPQIEYLKNSDIKTENGYVLVDSNMKTNIENIYACGDLIKKEAYQIITAASEGAKAAISCERGL